MDYNTLLSTLRLRTSTLIDRQLIIEAESDRGRLIFCPAFRRLQQKAQVFSMESNAAVRSRLTHSIEVSQVGRYIADLITYQLLEKNLATDEQCRAFVTFVETACLMHDIGNPPFGHFGEAAISEWFLKNGVDVIKGATGHDFSTDGAENTRALADFINFDGNPQGLRIVTKLQRNSDEFGLNLTTATLGAYLKYLVPPDKIGDKTDLDSCEKLRHFSKKPGYFTTEESTVKGIWSALGFTSAQRHPLAYVMEAADDIAYCISDLEDSLEKGLLDKEKTFKHLKEQWHLRNASNCKNSVVAKKIEEILTEAYPTDCKLENSFTFIDFRTRLSRVLCEYAAERYIVNHDRVILGQFPSLIPTDRDDPAGHILDLLKEFCRTHVYRHDSVQKTELAGYIAITGLLNHFRCILECSSERFNAALNYENKDKSNKRIVVEKKLLSLFPPSYIEIYKHYANKISAEEEDKTKEWVLRAHLVIDFISGMTDDFAIKTYQILSGIRL